MDGLPDGGRGPPFAYMTPQAGMFLSQMGLGEGGQAQQSLRAYVGIGGLHEGFLEPQGTPPGIPVCATACSNRKVHMQVYYITYCVSWHCCFSVGMSQCTQHFKVCWY